MTITQSFTGRRAVVLHPSCDIRARVMRRLETLGLEAAGRWPDLAPEDAEAHVVLIDLDRAQDEQFCWQPGHAPMPTIGLIGSETPGRLAWAVRQRLDAFLSIPALSNLFSALVLAHAAFDRRMSEAAREAEVVRRAGLRAELVEAVVAIMAEQGVDHHLALKQLRAYAMVERVALEDAALRYLAGARRAVDKA